MYSIKLNQFEGPLDLLLDLIEKKKLSINDLSLASISDQYLEYLKQLENFPLEEVAGFVVIASTLILIKSKSLIPSLELTEEEEQSIGELEERLRQYQRVKELSLNIKKSFGKNPQFSRESFKGMEMGFIEPKKLTLNFIVSTIKEILNNLPKIEKLPEIAVKKIISLEEKINELTDRIKTKMELSFAEFSKSRNSGGKELKVEIIVSFLAMLELVKRGIIIVSQSEAFDNIRIKNKE
ncbi:MAG: segregation/condensation protein A [Patescibacteria group bacterium]